MTITEMIRALAMAEVLRELKKTYPRYVRKA